MPYEIKQVSDGFKVCKKIGKKECYSKRGLTYNNALSQMRAIIISEMQRSPSKKLSKKTSKKSKKSSKKVNKSKKSSKK